MGLGTKVLRLEIKANRLMSMPLLNALKRVFRFEKKWLNLSTEKQIQIIIF